MVVDHQQFQFPFLILFLLLFLLFLFWMFWTVLLLLLLVREGLSPYVTDCTSKILTNDSRHTPNLAPCFQHVDHLFTKWKEGDCTFCILRLPRGWKASFVLRARKRDAQTNGQINWQVETTGETGRPWEMKQDVHSLYILVIVVVVVLLLLLLLLLIHSSRWFYSVV